MAPSVYLDSSVLLRKLFNQPHALSPWQNWEQGYISKIGRVECWRALDRERLAGRLRDIEIAQLSRLLEEYLLTLNLVDINDNVLLRASWNFPLVVGALDSIHVASALIVKARILESPLFLTHDVRQGMAAMSVGLETRGFDLPAS